MHHGFLLATQLVLSIGTDLKGLMTTGSTRKDPQGFVNLSGNHQNFTPQIDNSSIFFKLTDLIIYGDIFFSGRDLIISDDIFFSKSQI